MVTEPKIEFYKERIKQLLSRYESLTTEHSSVELLFDDQRTRYIALRLGWSGQKRIHLCLVHIDICNEKVVIQCNNTEDLVINELEEMGIPREQICSGFLPPEVRSLVEDELELVG